MKPESVKKYLFDILDSINAIQNFIKDTHDYKDFLSSRLIRSGVERELQVISEALHYALIIKEDLPISDVKKIRATRNILVHDYDGINYRIIWNIINQHLPILKTEVETILNNEK